MRFTLNAANPAEWLALRLGLVPVAAAEAWAGMALSGIVIAAVKSGMTQRLAAGSWTAQALAADLGLDATPVRLMLESLRSSGHVRERAGRYELSRSGRRWLAPGSPLSVAAFVAGASDYWDWWAGLDAVIGAGRPVDHHGADAGDPYWRRYVLGQLDLARLCAGEVARRLPVPAGARSVLDIGGAHGWYSAQLCRRHPQLSATVLDLPGSAAIGREVIAAAGLSDRVRHVDGDARMADLGKDHDVILCFNLVHHLTPPEIADLFARCYEALAPGGVLAVLDAFAGSGKAEKSTQASLLSLFTYLSSGSSVRTPAELRGWLSRAGFPRRPRRIRLWRIPGQALYIARK